jgi:hypothetical protein
VVSLEHEAREAATLAARAVTLSRTHLDEL